MKSYSFILITLIGIAGFSCKESTGESPSERKLVWSDEFDYQGAPDSSKWAFQLGNGCPDICGWGNNERQYYTRNPENVRVENGNLVIEAIKNDSAYSSARLTTNGKAGWKYGRVEARIDLPTGTGTWPAFWMLPSDWKYGGWPASGEIDIMEHVGYVVDSIFGTVHTGAYNHVKGTQKGGKILSADAEQNFHVYAIEWNAEKIDFFLDDTLYFTFANEHTGSEAWPFDQDFYLLLNLAVGGNWGGKFGIDDSIWPQRMVVDYVRVYSLEKLKS